MCVQPLWVRVRWMLGVFQNFSKMFAHYLLRDEQLGQHACGHILICLSLNQKLNSLPFILK